MTNLELLIEKLQNDLPDIVSNERLLEAGLATNHVQLFRARLRGKLPYLKLSSARIVYLKSDIIEWIRQNYHENNQKDEVTQNHGCKQ